MRPNVVPGTLELSFNWRYSTASTRESLAGRLEAVLRRHGLEYELEFPSSGKPYVTRRGRLVDVVSAAIAAECGFEPMLSCTGGTSDGRIADICGEVVELGPVNPTIHKLNERVAIADVDRLAALYRRVLEALLLDEPR